MQLKRKIGSLKSTLNVVIVIKIYFIKNIKHQNSLLRSNIDIKNTWKGINSIISLNTKESESSG